MNHPPAITNTQTNFVVLAGTTLTFTNTANDPDEPAQALSWNLISPPAGAVINLNSGIFSWRPSIAQSPATNLFALQISDNGSPSMSDTQLLLVTVSRPAQPVLAAPALTPGNFSLTVSGDSGPDYVVETTTNLAGLPNWQPLITNFAAVAPFQFIDSTVTNTRMKFYRVILQPL
jgi:hypothetical protein